MAYNAGVYPYALDPISSVSLYMIWWTDECIARTVNESYVLSKLQPKDQVNIKTRLAYGGGLTDDTYLQWIIRRAKRIFLTLVDIGIQEQIFFIVDDYIEDDDLPLSKDAIKRLPISSKHDTEVREKFFKLQYKYLVRHVSPGSHVDYTSEEVVPINVVPTRAQAMSLQNWTRVNLPGQGQRTFVRRWFPLDDASVSADPEADFLHDVETQKHVDNPHIIDTWASFTLAGGGCIISSFVPEHTLKSFFEQRALSQFNRMAREKRRKILLEWCHCLANAVSKMHLCGLCHSSIRPSNVIINTRNEIAFSEIGSLATFQKDKRPDERESYIYSAPEMQFTSGDQIPNLKRRNARKSTFGSIVSGSMALKNIGHFHRARPLTPPDSPTSPIKFSDVFAQEPREHREDAHDRSSARHSGSTDCTTGTRSTNSTSNSDMSEILNVPRLSEKADVFSLGCILLDIVTLLMKKKPGEFAKFRSYGEYKSGISAKGLDISFQANIPQVRAWIGLLEREASQKRNRIYKGVLKLLALIRSMLDPIPGMRPSAYHAQEQISRIFREDCGITDLHCAHHDEVPINPYELILANSKKQSLFAQEPVSAEPVIIDSEINYSSPRPSTIEAIEEEMYDFF